jgi:DNA helicase II / ATP-dependent DNA helicase PcrA
MPSRFLDALPPGLIQERRSSGGFGLTPGTRGAKSMWFGGPPRLYSGEIRQRAPVEEPEEVSQDAPRYVKGERVRHRRFGSGTIRGLDGKGRDLKVVVEFDDSEFGVKHLIVAYAGLERDWESA